MNLPRKPAYIYGRETAPNEKVYTEAALEEYGRAVQEACAMVCEEVNATTGECPELAIYCAEAIRNGVIREGEGEISGRATPTP